jgi:hypothetical protein
LSEQSDQQKDGAFVLSEKPGKKRENRRKKQETKEKWAEREALRSEKKQKQLARLEGLHSEICESTHPLISHDAWVNIMITLNVKLESTEDSTRCLNCASVISPGEISWVFFSRSLPGMSRAKKGTSKKTKVHCCQECGLPLILPIPGTSKKKKISNKHSNLPNPGALVPRKGVRLFSGQRRNWE